MLNQSLDIRDLINPNFNTVRYYIGKVVSSVLQFVHVPTLKTGLVARFSKSLTRTYLVTEGILKEIEEDTTDYTQEQRIAKHENSLVALSQFTKFYYKCERANFLGSETMYQAANGTLNNLHTIEAKFRMKAYSNESSVPEDKQLVEIASLISNNALTAE